MSEIVRNVSDKMLCPNSISEPIHEAHRLRIRILDAFYEAAVEDEETLEMPPALEKAYGAASDGPANDYMDLYRHSAFDADRRAYADAYWWRCHVCGFILPANRRELRA